MGRSRSRSRSLPRERRRRSPSRSRSRSHARRLSRYSRSPVDPRRESRRRSRSRSRSSSLNDDERRHKRQKKHSKKTKKEEKKRHKKHKHKKDKKEQLDVAEAEVSAATTKPEQVDDEQQQPQQQQEKEAAAPVDARSFFEQLQKREAAKEPVGTVHSRALPAPVSATAISKSDKWECSKAGCGHMNSKHAPACNKCGAMKRLTEWR